MDPGGQERSDPGMDPGGQERSDSGMDPGGQERSDPGTSSGQRTSLATWAEAFHTSSRHRSSVNAASAAPWPDS